MRHEPTGSVPLMPPALAPTPPAPSRAAEPVAAGFDLAEMLEPEPLATFDPEAPAPSMNQAPSVDMSAAPAPPPKKSSPMRAVVAGLVMLGVGGGGALGFLWWQKQGQPPPKPKQPVDMTPVRVVPPALDTAPPPKPVDAAPPVKAPDAAAPAKTPDAGVAAKAPDAAVPAKAPDAALAAKVPDAAPKVAVAPKPKPRWTPKPKPKPAAVTPPKPKPPANNLPTSLSRQDMLSVLKSNSGRLKVCFGDGAPPSTVSVAVTIARTGRVGSAKVLTAKVRRAPEAAKCIESQVKGYVFKAFNGETMRLTLPLRL